MSWTCSWRASVLLALAAAALSPAAGCAHAEAPPRLTADDPVEATLLNAREGNVLVRCRPADAEVWVDGVERGLASDFDGTRRLLSLAPGAHRLSFRHKGYAALEVPAVGPEAASRQTLDVSLTPLFAKE